MRGAEAEFYLPKRSRERSCERDSFQRTSTERSDKRLGSFCSSPYAHPHARTHAAFSFSFPPTPLRHPPFFYSRRIQNSVFFFSFPAPRWNISSGGGEESDPETRTIIKKKKSQENWASREGADYPSIDKSKFLSEERGGWGGRVVEEGEKEKKKKVQIPSDVENFCSFFPLVVELRPASYSIFFFFFFYLLSGLYSHLDATLR